jgi:hypothetical protein
MSTTTTSATATISRDETLSARDARRRLGQELDAVLRIVGFE